MSGTSNFAQWNPSQTNQETDAQYTVDALRTNGAANPSIFPSATANKLFYQLSTFIAAFANALAAKNYNLSDASLTTLAGVLANVVTNADLAAALAPYAPLVSPTMTGQPTAPTPATSDNSTKLATTGFVKAQNYISTVTGAEVVAGLGYTPVQQGGGANQNASNKLYLGWDGIGHVRLEVDANDFGPLPFMSDFASGFSTSSPNGWQKLPTGLILQWGLTTTIAAGTRATFNYPTAFPNVVFSINCTYTNNSAQTQATGGNPLNIESTSLSQFSIYNGGSGSAQFYWFAIGL